MTRSGLMVLALCCLLGSSGRPGAIRNDAAFWDMLTPAARMILAQVPVYIEPTCRGTVSHQPFSGGRYDWETNVIELCATDILAHPDILRHEALHALDRATWKWDSIRNGFFEAVPTDLYEQAEALYPGWFRPLELWATVPLIVHWQFDQLPLQVAAFYVPWFTGIGGTR
jgi:hypothetical protein